MKFETIEKANELREKKKEAKKYYDNIAERNHNTDVNLRNKGQLQ